MYPVFHMAEELGATVSVEFSQRPSDEGQWMIYAPSISSDDYLLLQEEVERMNESFNGWGYITLTRELPRCVCGREVEGINHINEAGGYCCPHYGNTCGYHR